MDRESFQFEICIATDICATVKPGPSAFVQELDDDLSRLSDMELIALDIENRMTTRVRIK